MATFFMFGNYSSLAINEIGTQRTDKAVNLIKKFGGEVKEIYALLGQHDLVLVVTLPGIEQAMKASLALSKMTGISFKTSPAVSVEEFDKFVTEL